MPQFKINQQVTFKKGVETRGRITAIRGNYAEVSYYDPYDDEPCSTMVALDRLF